MKTNNVKGWIRFALVVSGIALFAVLYFPIWRIDLTAPQYPEGLQLQIYAGKIGGNVEIINGLNHYIGMKTLHSNDFIEFTVLPYIIIFFAIAFIVTGIIARRKLIDALLALFICFGAIAMIDFWKWEYNYGHNLNPDAAIKIPGMAYQPPLIGFKQLLNFGAYSVPAIGGWIFIAAGFILLVCALAVRKIKRSVKFQHAYNFSVASYLLIVAFTSCTTKPQAFKIGTDDCYFCKMTISDARFGAEILTQKGKVYKFDDGHCVISFLKSKAIDESEIKNIYFVDFSGKHELLNIKDAVLLQSDALKSPMNGNIAAFSNKENADEAIKKYNAGIISWEETIAKAPNP